MDTKKIVSLISRIHNRAGQYIQEQLRINRIEGLVTSHGDIIVCLFQNPDGLTMGEIADVIDRDKSTVTALIAKLEERNYVERIPSLADRRMVYIRLTPKGFDLKPVFESISKSLLDITYDGIDEENRHIAIEILEKILFNWSENRTEEEK